MLSCEILLTIMLKINIKSEIGRLNAVLLHKPGAEVENMTPRNVQRALYSDILNLSIAQTEYEQLHGVLSKVSTVYQVMDLLIKVLDEPYHRMDLVKRICDNEGVNDYYFQLMKMESAELARVLIEGLPARINTFSSFLKNEYYALYPLYNFYFTRDAAITIDNAALVCKMANKVRVRESLIMDAIYKKSGIFDCDVIDVNESKDKELWMEGGDLLIARDDILLVGNGSRTSSKGVDYLVDLIKNRKKSGKQYLIVQQLPSEPESFIHLDMVYTFLDRDKAMVFEPLILQENQYQTVKITIENGDVSSIKSVQNIPAALKELGMNMESIICGGEDEWDQEREQWHSGANFFAFAPGKVISYARNVHTLNALRNSGFEVLSAESVINREKNVNDYENCVVSIEGSELPRGGGGARCMTMPLNRDDL